MAVSLLKLHCYCLMLLMPYDLTHMTTMLRVWVTLIVRHFACTTLLLPHFAYLETKMKTKYLIDRVKL